MPKSKRTRIPFIGHGTIGRSETINSERLINFYPELDPSGKATVSLHACPGLLQRGDVTGGSGRNLLEYENIVYAVIGNKLYTIQDEFDDEEVGLFDTTTGFISSATNGLVILYVDGDKGWTYTIASGVFAQITDADFPDRPTVCGILDNTFIVIDAGTQTFYTSPDGTSWAAADFASAETQPDDLVSMIVDHQELILFGHESTEIWYNAGGSFPFSRRAAIENGCWAKGSPAKIDNSVVWLDSKGSVRSLRGYTDQRISTHHEEYRIRQHTNEEIRAATAFAYAQEGHSFYQLTVGNETFVFDFATQKWHQRGYWRTDIGEHTRHRAECHCYYRTRNFVLDYEDGRFYRYDLEQYDDDGEYIVAIATFRHLDADGARVDYDEIEIELESGVGIQHGQGSDPKIEMQYSNDGGREWRFWRPADIGKVGLYRTRAKWLRLGCSNDRVFQFRITDPVKRSINNANLVLRSGYSS